MPRHRSATLSVQELEGRFAPATLVGATKVTYQDADGDNVAVVFSKPILNSGNVNDVFEFNTGGANGNNAIKQKLQSMNLTVLGLAAAGTAITVTATPSPVNGRRLAAVGHIGCQLPRPRCRQNDGDLGRVRAGDLSASTSGLKGRPYTPWAGSARAQGRPI